MGDGGEGCMGIGETEIIREENKSGG